MSLFNPGIVSLPCLKISVVAPKAPALIAASRCSIPFFTRLAAFFMRIAMLKGPIVRGLFGISIPSLIFDLRSDRVFLPNLERVIPDFEISINPSFFRCFIKVLVVPSPSLNSFANLILPIAPASKISKALNT